MNIIPGNSQHIGLRKEQQDSFGFSDLTDLTFTIHGGVFAVVADGMGGLDNGREASQLAVKLMLGTYTAKLPGEKILDTLPRALLTANEGVYRLAKETHGEGNVGTTLVAIVIHQDMLYWVAVGDSHIYLHRNGELIQLNTDHVYSRELAQDVAAGRIGRADALSHPERNALTSFLGTEKIAEIDQNVKPFPLRVGDRIVLCSDGLYGSLNSEEISSMLEGMPQSAADTLVAGVLKKGRTSQDNITVAILACEESELPKQVEKAHKFIHNIRRYTTILMLGLLVSTVFWQLASVFFENGAEEVKRTDSNPVLEATSNESMERNQPQLGDTSKVVPIQMPQQDPQDSALDDAPSTTDATNDEDKESAKPIDKQPTIDDIAPAYGALTFPPVKTAPDSQEKQQETSNCCDWLFFWR